MNGVNRLLASYEDLRLTITQNGTTWRVRVEETDDPDSALSGGIDYPSVEKAKRGAVLIALELFGTAVPPEELVWRLVNEPVDVAGQSHDND